MRFDHGYSEEDHLGKPYDLRLLKRLWPFLGRYRRLMAGSVALVVAITLLDLALPYFTKMAIDRHIVPTSAVRDATGSGMDGRSGRMLTVDGGDPSISDVVTRNPDLFMIQDGTVRIAMGDLDRLTADDRAMLRRADLEGLGLLVVLFLSVVLLDFIFTFIQKMIMEYAGHKVMHDLRLKLYDHLQKQSMTFFTKQPVARLVTRLTNDIQNMHELFTTFIALVFKDIFLLVGISIVFLAIDWRLALAGFSVLPIVALAAVRFSSRARDVFRAQRVKVAEINTRMAETIDGIKTLQVFCREKDNYDHFSDLNAANYRLGMRQIHVYAVFMPVVEMLGIISVAILLWFGGWRVFDGAISLGALVAVLSYIRMFFRPLRDLAENYNILQNAMASAERIFALFDMDHTLPAASSPFDGTEDNAAAAPLIALENVSFAYNPDEPVLRDVSFEVQRGQTVALVGPTGAGKTSILNLVLRLYDPDAGAIQLGNRALKDWDLGALRSKMALVPQDPMLFSGTLRDNIVQAAGTVPDRQLGRIIEAANCVDLVRRMPDGLDTPLTKSGEGLSSGERQLVAIARAFARNPEILLLDEATSHIDSHTETAIHSALGNLMQGRTCILVAHRLSTARLADQIVVVKAGRVQEAGRHAQLLDSKGFYWHLNQQSARAEALS